MNQSSMSQLKARIQLSDILPILRRNLLIVVVCVVTALILSAVATAMIPRKYSATALVQVTPGVVREVTRKDAMDIDLRGYREVERYYRTQIQLIESRSLMLRVLERYHEMGYDDIPKDESGATQLKGMVTAAHKDDSQLVAISVVHTDPARAAILANLTATSFERENLNQRRQAASGAREWLQESIRQVKQRHTDAVDELYAFVAENDLADIGRAETELGTRSGTLDTSFAELTRETVLLQAQITQHQKLLNQGRWMVLAGMIDEPVLNSLVGAHAEARAECAALSATKGEKHPSMVRCTERLDKLAGEIKTELRTTVAAQRAKLSALQKQTEQLDAAGSGARTEMLARRSLEARYLELKREIEQTEETHQMLLKRSDELDLSSRTQLNNIRVVDLALEPSTHVWPNLYINLAAGFMLGLLGGVLISLARAFLDETIRSPEDVNTYLGLPVLGVLPRFAKGEDQQREIVAHIAPRSVHAEAMRGVRAMIDLRPNADPPRRVLVTSAVASEGKTSVACRLGVAIAQQGQRVVLVEADHRRARLHKVFGMDGLPGVSDYLKDGLPLEDCVHETEVPGLFVMPLGVRRGGTTELLAAGHIDDLLADLEANYDRLIFDTAPSAALTEGVALSQLADGVVVVVRAGSVGRGVVRHTLDRYRNVGAELLGIVLNDAVEESWILGRYVYGYRSNYYYYYGDPENEPGEAAK